MNDRIPKKWWRRSPRAGADLEALFKANEGHSFLLEENRMEFHRRAERFLAKHLGGRVENERVRTNEISESPANL